MVRSESEHIASLFIQSDFANAAWRLRALGLHSIDDEDSMLQLKLVHWLSTNLEIWVGTDLFFGTSRGLFGQFDGEDRVLLGLQYGF